MDVLMADMEDEFWIKKIYSQSKSELGSFNLFYSWENYLNGKGKFIVIKGMAFVRYDWSKKYRANVVYEIGTMKEERGNGYGAYIIRFVPPPVLLKCNADNNSGNKFYLSIGMKLSGTTETKNGKPQNIYTCVEW